MTTLAQIPQRPPGPDTSPEDQRKRAMRRDLRHKLAAMSPIERRTHSEAVCEKLARSAYVSCSRCVMLYAPMPTEVDIGPIIRQCLQAGNTVCLPRVDWESGTMDPASITDWPAGLIEATPNLLQPPQTAPRVELDSIDLVVIPGLGFDRHGARLGRGGGFYDRFLAQPGLAALRVGVAFDLQIVESIPVRHEADRSNVPAAILRPGASSSHPPDARVHAVYTDRRILLGTDPHALGTLRPPETTG